MHDGGLAPGSLGPDFHLKKPSFGEHKFFWGFSFLYKKERAFFLRKEKNARWFLKLSCFRALRFLASAHSRIHGRSLP
jgi:hypothetical protein